jgi:hypothetical protein
MTMTLWQAGDIVARQTTVTAAQAREVLHIISTVPDAMAAIEIIRVAQFYEVDPVWMARGIRQMVDLWRGDT